MDIFYTPAHLITPPTIRIEGDEYAHLSHVMRKVPNDTIGVVDGVGNYYEAVILETGGRSAVCTVITHRAGMNEPPREVILGAALLKHGAAFDYLVEKATELGVRAIVPLRTERTIPFHAKPDRWQKLALAAMKQSQRCVLPSVQALVTFPEFLQDADTSAVRLIPHEKTDQPRIRDVIPDGGRRVIIAIGPEGGFSDAEVELATGSGFVPVGLGPRRLRAETAALVAVAAATI